MSIPNFIHHLPSSPEAAPERPDKRGNRGKIFFQLLKG
jgi:hypothetical protein